MNSNNKVKLLSKSGSIKSRSHLSMNQAQTTSYFCLHNNLLGTVRHISSQVTTDITSPPQVSYPLTTLSLPFYHRMDILLLSVGSSLARQALPASTTNLLPSWRRSHFCALPHILLPQWRPWRSLYLLFFLCAGASLKSEEQRPRLGLMPRETGVQASRSILSSSFSFPTTQGRVDEHSLQAPDSQHPAMHIHI